MEKNPYGKVAIDGKVTDRKQAHVEQTREYFLQGVLEEANRQGYGKYAMGRLFVQAVRSWERR